MAIFPTEAFSATNELTPELIERMVLSERHRFETDFGWGALLAAAVAVDGQGIATPEHLGAIPPAGAAVICQFSLEPRVARALLGAQRLICTQGGKAAKLFQPPGVVLNDTLMKASKRHAKQFEMSRKITTNLPR